MRLQYIFYIIIILCQWLIVDHFIKHDTISRLADLSILQLVRNLLSSYSWMSPNCINHIFWNLAIEFQFCIIIGLFYNLLFEQKSAFFFVLFFVLLTSCYLVFDFSKYTISGYPPMFAMGGATLLLKK